MMPDSPQRDFDSHLLQFFGDGSTPQACPPQSLDDVTDLLVDYRHLSGSAQEYSNTVDSNTTI